MLIVDVRYLGSGDIFEDFDVFQQQARLFDQDNNSFVNERYLKIFPKCVEKLKKHLDDPWNSMLSKPRTPTKDYVFKKISPIENPRDPITCHLCPKKPVLKNKKGYKIHCIKFHKNEATQDFSQITDDIGVTCMLTKKDGSRCSKIFDIDQIYR